MNTRRSPISRLLSSLARVIQFRSELAILAVLAGGVVAGMVVRGLRPGPSATIAAPSAGADHRSRPVPGPRLPSSDPSQVVDVR